MESFDETERTTDKVRNPITYAFEPVRDNIVRPDPVESEVRGCLIPKVSELGIMCGAGVSQCQRMCKVCAAKRSTWSISSEMAVSQPIGHFILCVKREK